MRPTSAALGSKKGFTKELDKEVINSMHKTLLGGERDLPPAWGSQGLTFREQGMRCGLTQHEGGPCGVLAAVQAFVLRELLLDENAPPLAELPPEAAGEALIGALAHIIWSARMGRLANVVVCKRPTLPSLRESAGEFICTECKSADDVAAAVRAGIGAFMRAPGVAMLLYSLLLTRGIAMVQRDADFPATLIAPNGYCAQELVNLLLYGRAHSNVFDGEQTVGGEAGTAEGCRLRGTPRRSPVGFLTLFERQGEPGSLLQVALACNLVVLMPCSPHAASATRPQPRLHPHQVGSHLKRPGCAVFVLQSESHYSVLWAPGAAPDLELPSEESAPADGMEGYGDDFEADTEEGGGAPGPDELGDGSAAAFRWGGAAPFDGAFDLMYFDQMGEATEPVRVRDRCNTRDRAGGRGGVRLCLGEP